MALTPCVVVVVVAGRFSAFMKKHVGGVAVETTMGGLIATALAGAEEAQQEMDTNDLPPLESLIGERHLVQMPSA